MSNIHSILPLLDTNSWRWNKSEISRERIQPGNREPLFDRPKYPGFVYFASVAVQGEGAEQTNIEFDFDRFQTDRSIEELFRVGLTGSAGISPAVRRFDVDDGLFAIRIAPNVPVGYTDAAAISVRAPSDTEIVSEALGLNLEILDMDSFMSSYQRATAGQMIDKMDEFTDKLDRLNNNIELMLENGPGEVEVPDNGGDDSLDFIDDIV